MNPLVYTLCFLAQGLLLQRQSPWGSALGLWALLSLIFFLFAWSRLRWNQHLDMLLIMLGPGSLAMLTAIKVWMPNCPFRQSALMALPHLGLMSAGMLAVSLPITWHYARCLIAAKAERRALQYLSLDSLGMILGMATAHAAFSRLPHPSPWLEHTAMLIAMSCGMMLGRLTHLRLLHRQSTAWTET